LAIVAVAVAPAAFAEDFGGDVLDADDFASAGRFFFDRRGALRTGGIDLLLVCSVRCFRSFHVGQAPA
jgi:hypothetical protein